jgi:hypothetical protein
VYSQSNPPALLDPAGLSSCSTSINFVQPITQNMLPTGDPFESFIKAAVVPKFLKPDTNLVGGATCNFNVTVRVDIEQVQPSGISDDDFLDYWHDLPLPSVGFPAWSWVANGIQVTHNGQDGFSETGFTLVNSDNVPCPRLRPFEPPRLVAKRFVRLTARPDKPNDVKPGMFTHLTVLAQCWASQGPSLQVPGTVAFFTP